MANLPSNLPKILRDVGLKVVEVDGWRDRGRPGAFAPVGVLCHHTATRKSSSDAAVVRLLRVGRSDLPGPLAQLGLARDGTVYLIAAGRANHAGRAKASGTVAAGDGNELYIGIEAFNDGVGEPWPAVQREAYELLSAVLSVKITGNSAQTVRGHKETSVTGKIDPRGIDMGAFRTDVAAKIKALTAPPPPRPASHTRWAIRTTGVHATPGGKKLRNLATGEAFRVIDGSGHGNDGWIETTHGNWVLGKDTTTYDPALPKRFSVATWNVENKGDADAVLDRAEIIKLCAERKPTYFCLQEVYRVNLADIPGYQTYQAWEGYTADSENRAQAILIRDDVAVKIMQALQMTEEWTGPKMGIEKDPRVHRYVVGNEYELNFPVATMHVPFPDKGDRAPIEETKLAAIEWLETMRRAHGRGVIVADWNSLADGLQAKVGDPAGATVDGGGLDRAVFVGLKKVKGENLGNRGRSDHPVKIWTFEA